MDQTKQSDSKIKTVGIIIPPSEIRKIADKTAEFVAKNGPSFEDLVIKAETNNPKFSFLKQDDPYRSYYDHKVSEFGKQVANEAQAQSKTQESISSINIQNTKPISFPSQNQLPQSNQNNIINNNISQKNKNDLRMPLPDQYTVEHPANVTMLDIDIIKHTAQFVAKNGKNFLIALTEREKQNPQFDFLKPTHILFSFFTNLVDAYSKCIYVKKEELQKLQLNIQERMHILNRALERFEYEYMQKQVKKKKEEIDEEERMQMAQIDWNDFIIVETIDLFENEELPAPHSFDKNNEKIKLKNQQIEIEEKKISIPIIPGKLLPQPPVQIPNLQEIQLSISEQLIPLNVEENTKVKKNYVRKSGNSENTTVKCDVCGHNIPVNEYNEHLRIELMDPKHQIMKQDLSQRAQNTAIATGEELSQNLQIFSKKRPDIFGTAEDQFNKEEQKKKQAAAAAVAEKNLWDNNPINRPSSNLPVTNQSKKNIEEIKIPTKPEKPVSISLNRTLIDDIKTATEEKKPNLIPEKPIINPDIPISHMIPPPIIPPMNLPIPINKPSMPLIMDPTKFVREENVNLIPEDRWLELNPHNLQINIKIPDGGSEDNWNFNGQIIQLEVDPRTKIGRIKDLLSGLLGDMPVSKQKLKSTMFSVLKDQHSLAYYNMINGLMLELNAKERGGKSRKK